jgi:PleD family two-component response regulator
MVDDILRILLIEDNPHDKVWFTESLSRAGKYKLHRVERISSALELTSRYQFDVILLDHSPPDRDGLDPVKSICAADLPIPIIVLNDVYDDALALQAVQYGVQDYLVKDQVAGHFLTRAIRHAIERKRTTERLKYMATHDELTGLPNRVLFYDRLQHALVRADRARDKGESHWMAVVMLLDLDCFKAINDTLGHAKGDEVLCMAVERLRGCLRASDTISRLGGDEFVILIEGIAATQDCGAKNY